ncbi:MAG: hypothetical protein V1706_10670 [Pseudomonadota bacterium]
MKSTLLAFKSDNFQVKRNSKYGTHVIAAVLFAMTGTYSLLSEGTAQAQGMGHGMASPEEAQCRACHEDLVRFPSLGQLNPDKHHLLVGLPAILPTAPPSAILTDTYECMSCHPLVWNSEISLNSISLYRDCLDCHAPETVSGPPRRSGTNRHHKLDYQCNVCHEDGHR